MFKIYEYVGLKMGYHKVFMQIQWTTHNWKDVTDQMGDKLKSTKQW